MTNCIVRGSSGDASASAPGVQGERPSGSNTLVLGIIDQLDGTLAEHFGREATGPESMWFDMLK